MVDATFLLEMEADPEKFRNFFRMNLATFAWLLDLVEGAIRKRNTNMRQAVTAKTRLAVTLRFLATGDSFPSLSYLFRIGSSTISRWIVPECVAAIWQVLRGQYGQVNNINTLI